MFGQASSKACGGILGQPLVIKNVDGGGGEVGVMEALNAPADGYTIFHLERRMLH